MQGKSGYCGVYYKEGEEPSFCYRTGLTVYEEVFKGGALCAAGWNTAGYPLDVLSHIPSRVKTEDLANPNSFHLELDGEYADRGLKFVSFTQNEEGGSVHAVVTLLCERKKARIKVHTLLDGTPILTRWLTVENLSEASLAVSELGVISGGIERIHIPFCGKALPDEIYSVGYMDADNHMHEGDFSFHLLHPDVFSFGGGFSRRRYRYPMFMLRNEVAGRILYGQLGWSGGWRFDFDYNAHPRKDRALLSFGMFVDTYKPICLMRPGETITTPKAHIGMMAGDVDEAVQAMHAHQRRSVLPPSNFNIPVEAGIGPEHDMTVETTKASMDQMAYAGAEAYIVDAGWYCPPGLEVDWQKRVGYWHADPDRYPNGLKELRDYCHLKGMKFGIWMEPGRAAASLLQPAHPEWFPTYIDGSTTQIFPDFTNPEVVAWTEEEIARVITEYGVEIIKFDYNIDNSTGSRLKYHVKEEDGRVECRAFRHMQAVADMYGRLRARFPDVIFENCASGGGRCDLDFIANFDHTWVSDNQMAPRSLYITNGMTLALPPERVDRMAAGMSGHKDASLDFHMRNIMLGHMSINIFSPRLAEMNPDALDFVKHSVSLYKAFIRPMLPESLYFHHTPTMADIEAAGFATLELATPDRSQAAIAVFSAPNGGGETFVRPRGLDMGKTYRVWLDNSRTQCVMTGAALINEGVRVRIDHALASELLLFSATGE